MWDDRRFGTGGPIYAQKVSPSGNPIWATNGIQITLASDWIAIVSDGNGGIILTAAQKKFLTQDWDIFAKRISSSGSQLWSTIQVCDVTNCQVNPRIVSDGSGGAIISWQDERNGTRVIDASGHPVITNSDIYAQRIKADGSVATGWTLNGVRVCTAEENQYPLGCPRGIVSDGSGGAIMVWLDERNLNSDIYAQRIKADGSVATGWTLNGVPVCTAVGYHSIADIVSDGSGGVIITWLDNRSGSQYIYAQKINSNGTTAWTTNGIPISTAAGAGQLSIGITGDGSEGAIIFWYDNRSGNGGLYAQRINSSGSPLWTPTNGVQICTADATPLPLGIVSDMSGGAIMAWSDNRRGDIDIYAQVIDKDGMPQCTTGGLQACTTKETQWFSEMDSDGMGGAIFSWEDSRAFAINNRRYDVYAQRIGCLGGGGPGAPIISDFRVDGVSTGDAISCQPRVWVTITDEVTPYAITTIELSIDGHTYRYSTLEVDYDNITGHLIYRFPDKYPKGIYTITVRAWDIDGNMSEASVSNLEIKSSAGAPEIVDTPRADNPQWTAGNPPGTTLAYTLNNDADIMIYVYKDKKVLYKKRIPSGSPGGGMGGYNEVFWDGLAGDGSNLGVGIYTVVIASKNDKLGELTIMVTP